MRRGRPTRTQQSHLSSQDRCLHTAQDAQHPWRHSAPRHHNWHSHEGSTTVTPWMCTSKAQPSVGTNFKSARLPSLSISHPHLGFFSFACATARVLLPRCSWPWVCLSPCARGILVMGQAHHSITQAPVLASSLSPLLASPPGPKRRTPAAVKNLNFRKQNPDSRRGSSGKNRVSAVLGNSWVGWLSEAGAGRGGSVPAPRRLPWGPQLCSSHIRGIPLSSCSPPSPCNCSLASQGDFPFTHLTLETGGEPGIPALSLKGIHFPENALKRELNAYKDNLHICTQALRTQADSLDYQSRRVVFNRMRLINAP